MTLRRTVCGAFGLLWAVLASAVQIDESRIDRLGPFTRDSDGLSEFSSTPYAVTVRTAGMLRVSYHAPRTHCSSVRIRFALDGRPAPATAPVAPGQDSDTVDFGPQEAGTHRLEVNAAGIVGGCNTGRLLSWGGSLSLTTTGREAGPVGAFASRSDVIFATEKIGYGRGDYTFEYIDARGTVHRSAGRGRSQPVSDDGYYGFDWLSTALAEGSIVSHVEASQLSPYQTAARTLAARMKEDAPVRRPLDRGPTTTLLLYAWDGTHGAYRRIVLSEHGQKLWSSAPPPSWEEGSTEAAQLTAWLSHFDDGVRDR